MKYLIIIFLLLGNSGLQAQSTKGKLPSTSNSKPAKKIALTNAEERVKYYALSHTDERGQPVAAPIANMEAYEQLQAQARSNSNSGDWNFLGPDSLEALGLWGLGRVNRIDFHPTDPDQLYASTAGGGLWYTSDGGDFWYPLTDGIPVLNTSGVVVNHQDPQTIYLLTGDGDGEIGTSAYGDLNLTRTSIGVLKTIDGGITWKKTALQFTQSSKKTSAFNILMHPQDTARVYACTNRGVFITDDGFETVDTVLANRGRIYEMKFSPVYSNVAYAVGEDSLYRSADGGRTWPQSMFLDSLDGEFGRVSMDLVGITMVLLAGPVNADTLMRGVFRGFDFGTSIPSLTLMSNSPNFFAGFGRLKDQSSYDIALCINPTNTSEIVTGGVYMFKSTDGGANFDYLDRADANKKYHADAHQLRVNPLDGKLYACNDGGIYVSEDFGESWNYKAFNMGIAQYYRCGVSPFNPELILAGAQDNGVQLRKGDLKTFEHVFPNDGMEVHFSNQDSLTGICCTQFGYVGLTTDGWATDSVILNLGSDSSSWLTPIAFDPTDDNIIYVGGNPIFKSIDQGLNWTALTPDTVSANTFLTVAPSNPNVIYAGEYITPFNADDKINIIIRSDDGGATWTTTSIPVYSELRYSDLSINPDDEDDIWLSVGGYSFNHKVYRSIDGGDSWTNEKGALPNVPINSIEYLDDDTGPNGSVYVATDIGVFYRNNSIGDWVPFSNGLPQVEVADLKVDYINETIVIATYGRGVWRSPFYEDCPAILIVYPADQPFWKRHEFRSSYSILSTAINSGVGSDVIYQAGNHVRLHEGFISRGSTYGTLRVKIGGCEE